MTEFWHHNLKLNINVLADSALAKQAIFRWTTQGYASKDLPNALLSALHEDPLFVRDAARQMERIASAA